jgi:hypothetical protein
VSQKDPCAKENHRTYCTVGFKKDHLRDSEAPADLVLRDLETAELVVSVGGGVHVQNMSSALGILKSQIMLKNRKWAKKWDSASSSSGSEDDGSDDDDEEEEEEEENSNSEDDSD